MNRDDSAIPVLGGGQGRSAADVDRDGFIAFLAIIVLILGVSIASAVVVGTRVAETQTVGAR